MPTPIKLTPAEIIAATDAAHALTGCPEPTARQRELELAVASGAMTFEEALATLDAERRDA